MLDESKEQVMRNIDALNSKNYCQRMHYMLWIEEHQQNMNLHSYDQKEAVLLVVQRGPDTFHQLEVSSFC